jgi:IS5 family transposase
MKPKKINHKQGRFFEIRLSDQLNPKNGLIQLSKNIDWETIEREIEGIFNKNKGRPPTPVRSIVGLLMLQHIFGLSDENVVFNWLENPYWQYFCGYDYLQWKCPIDPSSLSRWRGRIGEEGLDRLLSHTVHTAERTKTIEANSLKKVIADTTVMEKNITYPTDSKLYKRGIDTLVRMAKAHSIPLRQTYSKLSKKALFRTNRYCHARQMKRAKKEMRRLKTYLGRVNRDIKRKIKGNPELEFYFSHILKIVDQVLEQKRSSKNKIYSIHESHVECISKGKSHKKFEFGCKVSFVLTHKEGIILSAKAIHGNPYDGHTLKDVIKNAESVSEAEISNIFVDKGYRGHKIKEKNVYISGQKRLTRYFKNLLKRRQAIEPHIGHMKFDGKLGRNYLRGEYGDKLNATLSGIGHNLRIILNNLAPKRKKKTLA